jgi:hypothetical protein
VLFNQPVNNLNNNNMLHSNFEKRFEKRRKFISIFFVFNVIITIGAICLMSHFAYNAFSNPELIGVFFGKILKGFNSAK